MYDDVVARLKSLSYKVYSADQWMIQFIIGKVTDTIKNECNINEIPDGLQKIAVDMVCGEFLLAKKGSGQLTKFNVEAAVKKIEEGDTSVTYAVPDNSVTLDGLIMWLMNCGKSQFVKYRRFAW